MENPWRKLRTEANEYVLEEDRECLMRHNRSANEVARFALGSIPEPFIGSPDTAIVVLLGKNPGHAPGAESEYRANRELREAMFCNLRHELRHFPFYPFDPRFARSGAGKWWLPRTRELQAALRGDLERLAQRVMVIEWFPYHSIAFRAPETHCPSQNYSFHLLRRMMEKGALVVGMRARKLWQREAAAASEVRFLKNPQCGHISRGNTEPDLFDEIVAKLAG